MACTNNGQHHFFSTNCRAVWRKQTINTAHWFVVLTHNQRLFDSCQRLTLHAPWGHLQRQVCQKVAGCNIVVIPSDNKEVPSHTKSYDPLSFFIFLVEVRILSAPCVRFSHTIGLPTARVGDSSQRPQAYGPFFGGWAGSILPEKYGAAPKKWMPHRKVPGFRALYFAVAYGIFFIFFIYNF